MSEKRDIESEITPELERRLKGQFIDQLKLQLELMRPLRENEFTFSCEHCGVRGVIRHKVGRWSVSVVDLCRDEQHHTAEYRSKAVAIAAALEWVLSRS